MSTSRFFRTLYPERQAVSPVPEGRPAESQAWPSPDKQTTEKNEQQQTKQRRDDVRAFDPALSRRFRAFPQSLRVETQGRASIR